LVNWEHPNPTFAVDYAEASLMTLMICLSYLIYDISRGKITEKEMARDYHYLQYLLESFPLLRYSILWLDQVGHNFRGRESQNSSQQELSINAGRLLEIASTWLRQKLCVTAWIESNYFYNCEPRVSPLISIPTLVSEQYTRGNSQLSGILQSLGNLEKDLGYLRNEWNRVLFDEPSAIWTSTITAFTKSMFWSEALEAKVTALTSKDKHQDIGKTGSRTRGPKSILLKSQNPENGSSVGSVVLIPSS
jgi:hypothetical protein